MLGRLFDEKSSILKISLETFVERFKVLVWGVVDEGKFLGSTRYRTGFGLLLFRSAPK
jgi:hypothetical protein